MSKKLSVIVPIYNIENYVGKCIESILLQTYQNLEIILVDDGSTDRSSDLCDLYAKKDNRIIVVHKKNGGLVSARKAGINIATGEYATYVDGDDWIDNDYYYNMMSIIKDEDVIISGFKRVLFEKSAEIFNNIGSGLYTGQRLDYLRDNMLSINDSFRLGVTTYVWNKIFKRDVLYEYQMRVDERISIGEDAAVVYPLLLNCKSVNIVNIIGYNYRQRADSMLKQKKSFDVEKVGLRTLRTYLSNNMAAKYNGQIDNFILAQCIIRSGGLTSTDLFAKNIADKNIVIYSAGTFGQQLINRLHEKKYANLVGWVDEDYWEYRRGGIEVDPVDSILNKKYDYVVIAALDFEISNTIKESLFKVGIEKDKILTISKKWAEKSQLIERMLML